MNGRYTPLAQTTNTLSPVTLPVDCALSATETELYNFTQTHVPTPFALSTFTFKDTTREFRPTRFEYKTQRLLRWREKEWSSHRATRRAKFLSKKCPGEKKRCQSFVTNLYGWPLKKKRCLSFDKTRACSPSYKQKLCYTPALIPTIKCSVSRCDAAGTSKFSTKIQESRLTVSITAMKQKALSLPCISEMLCPHDLYALSRICCSITPCFRVIRMPLKFAKLYAASSEKKWTARQVNCILEKASCTPFGNAKNMMKFYFRRVLPPSVLWQVASMRNDVFSMRRALSNHLSSSASRWEALEILREK